jgi:hypothetical protein
MLTLKDFSEIFNGHNLPAELLQVLEFQNNTGGVFSEGFKLSANEREALYYGWSKDPDFLNDLFPFARANASGSFYAFWSHSTTASLNDMPIVIFGDEGGEHIVAEGFLAFLRLLTYDAAPMVDHREVIYYKDQEGYEPSPKSGSFRKWVKNTFEIDQANSPDEIVHSAQKKYQAAFNEWKLKYL